MDRLISMDQLEEAIATGAVLVYISAPQCRVCDALKIKVEELFTQRFPKIRLLEANVAELPGVQGRFGVFSAPTMLLFFDGQEFLREGRNVSLERLAPKLEKLYALYFSDR
ncbi:MAG: thioredoxin [Nitratiruptor sp.]|nr:thioredoxin [Nitratiruptor sp.]NPA84024.1 thioredoxin family protein [Campylobacterota bacterium]